MSKVLNRILRMSLDVCQVRMKFVNYLCLLVHALHFYASVSVNIYTRRLCVKPTVCDVHAATFPPQYNVCVCVLSARVTQFFCVH